MSEVMFFSDEVDFSLENEKDVSDWMIQIANSEEKILSDLNVIFTSDDKLLKINKDFLDHDYYTDIVTFQNVEGEINGEIYISVDRVKENAEENKVGFVTELHRVMAHGILHMAGYGDKSNEEIKAMRSKEDFYINLRPV